jgi:hypothetical protein
MTQFKVTFDDGTVEDIDASSVHIDEPWAVFSDVTSGVSHLLRTRDVKRIDKVQPSATSDNP